MYRKPTSDLEYRKFAHPTMCATINCSCTNSSHHRAARNAVKMPMLENTPKLTPNKHFYLRVGMEKLIRNKTLRSLAGLFKNCRSEKYTLSFTFRDNCCKKITCKGRNTSKGMLLN